LTDGHHKDEQDFVFEGGSIESEVKVPCCNGPMHDAPHRNQPMDVAAIEARLKNSRG
jgi:hypothetical protein